MSKFDRAKQAYLARYSSGTRELYALDLRIFEQWCARSGIDKPLKVTRTDLESFATWLQTTRKNSPRSTHRRLVTVRGMFNLALADGLVSRNPFWMLRMPRWHVDPDRRKWMDRFEVGAILRAAQNTSPAHHALIALMSMAGLRVSEACNVQIEDYQGYQDGGRVLRLVGKGGRPATIILPAPLLEIMDTARGDRTQGPLITRRNGEAQSRRGAYDWVQRVSSKAGVSGAHPHGFRHAGITAVLEATGDIYAAQKFGRHADIRTTEGYIHRSKKALQGVHVATHLFASAS